MEYEEKYNKLKAFIKKCKRQWYKPDLHSFCIKISGGFAFVDCEDADGVWVEVYDENGQKCHLKSTVSEITKYLIDLGADLTTIEQ